MPWAAKSKMKNITIVGLGLMGGSLAAACRKEFPKARIFGVSRDPKAIAYALKKKWIHQGFLRIEEALKVSGLIVLCTPVDTLQSLLLKIKKSAQPGTLVTDVGSVKGDIGRWAESQRFKNFEFVGAHPMTGSHERGILVARPDLYEHGFTFVVRSRKNSAAAYAAVKNFWKKMSPKVVEVSAEEHDQITAEISHLPHLAAACLALAPGKKSFQFTGTGFSDATRIAQGHPSVWVPIFMANRRAVLQALQGFERHLKVFRKALKKGDNSLGKILSEAAKRRREISL